MQAWGAHSEVLYNTAKPCGTRHMAGVAGKYSSFLYEFHIGDVQIVVLVLQAGTLVAPEVQATCGRAALPFALWTPGAGTLPGRRRGYHWRSHERRMPWSRQSNRVRLLQRRAA